MSYPQCEESGCAHGMRAFHGSWWDREVKLSTVIHWLAHATTGEIRDLMGERMTDQSFEEWWRYCSKTTFWDIASEWLVEADDTLEAEEARE